MTATTKFYFDQVYAYKINARINIIRPAVAEQFNKSLIALLIIPILN
jgi:hypothetical protein